MNALTDKVALVTGSSRGIGRSIALELAAAGCDVMLTARDAKALNAAAAEIRHNDVHVLLADGQLGSQLLASTERGRCRRPDR